MAEGDPVQLEELPDLPPGRMPDCRRTGRTIDYAAESAAGLRLYAGGYKLLPRADGQDADDPIGSMGTDTPIAVLSSKPKLLYNYFKQNFAQVTNPPIDPIREELVMSLVSMIGPRPNLLGHHAGTHNRLEVSQPILTNADLEKVRAISSLVGDAFRTKTIDTTWPAGEYAADGQGGRSHLHEATDAVLDGFNILILSDRAVSAVAHPDARAARHRVGASSSDPPRPAHQHRSRGGNRRGARGAPFLRARRLWRRGDQPLPRVRNARADPRRERSARTADQVQKNYLKGVGKGILKVMSKMGISTYQSYCGAQIFDAVGLSSAFVEKCFTGTASTIEGAGFDEIAREAVQRHQNAYGEDALYAGMLDAGGDYAFRLRGEDHAWTPDTITKSAARRTRQFADRLHRLHRHHQRPEQAPADAAWPDGATVRRHADTARRSRARRVDREALRHRRDELRLDLA